MNKFLNQYPQLREPKIGDRIKVIKILNILKEEIKSISYNIGEVGTIQDVFEQGQINSDRIYEVDFEVTKAALLYQDEFIIIDDQ